MIANRYTQATTVGVSNNESLDRDSSARLTSGNSWKRERFIRNERNKKNENKKKLTYAYTLEHIYPLLYCEPEHDNCQFHRSNVTRTSCYK